MGEESICCDSHKVEGGVSYQVLGVDIPVDENEENLAFHCLRVAKIENLENCKDVKSLEFVSNHITKIENIQHLNKLVKLDLYQNHIQKIENIESQINLEYLDFSFNNIRKIENLSHLTHLRKLFLANNKITQIENIESLENLEELELGSNRIRAIEGIGKLQKLENLWLGKNKIDMMKIPFLLSIKRLSLQACRLREWNFSIFENSTLEELYLSENKLAMIPGEIQKLKKLRILDLGNNIIASGIEALIGLDNLNEIWMNDNSISSIEEIRPLVTLKSLRTIYLERNPFQASLGPAYRMTVASHLPQVVQLDASAFPLRNP